MTRPRVGWYVHHHGRGHLARLVAIAPHVDADIICFSSFPRPEALPANCSWIQLERDDGPEPETGDAPGDRNPDADGLLHWAPLLHGGHRRRLTAIATTIAESPVSAFVVDVSVEVTLFVRLLGIPVVLMTQPGDRDDEPHRLAFRAATVVIAPWPQDLLHPDHLVGARNVVYVGGISRFDEPLNVDEPAIDGASRSGVVLLGGAGGSSVSADSIDQAIAATPGTDWSVLGFAGRQGAAWADDPSAALRGAEIVVSWAGQNSIADIAVAGAKAVVIPQDRPFGEQAQSAHALERAGLAVVEPAWPTADAWPGVLHRARTLEPDWSRWQTAGAASRAAAHISAVAGGARP